MPGPDPKNPAVRARRNRVSTNRTLRGVGSSKVPALPSDVVWRKPVVEWWGRAFSSPMSDEWTVADVDSMYMAAALLQSFWDPECGVDLRVRITGQVVRILGECGLTPMARRRLQWQVEQGEEASAKTSARRSARSCNLALA